MTKTNIVLQPVSGYILVQPDKPEEVTASGIVLPRKNEDKPQKGKVLAIGPDFLTDAGTKKSAPCKVGDVVIYREWGGKEYKHQDVEYMLLKFEDIVAILN